MQLKNCVIWKRCTIFELAVIRVSALHMKSKQYRRREWNLSCKITINFIFSRDEKIGLEKKLKHSAWFHLLKMNKFKLNLIRKRLKQIILFPKCNLARLTWCMDYSFNLINYLSNDFILNSIEWELIRLETWFTVDAAWHGVVSFFGKYDLSALENWWALVLCNKPWQADVRKAILVLNLSTESEAFRTSQNLSIDSFSQNRKRIASGLSTSYNARLTFARHELESADL